jgi:non-heme chloroperoxidase
MRLTTTDDGTHIFYKDWGSGQPIVFCHGWPLDGDAWDPHMMFFGGRGYRVIAHDRRGHGRSSQTWGGNDMDTYADDLAELLEVLDLRKVILVGHSTGGGEVVRYIGRHGSERVDRLVLISAVPPLMARTVTNPDGIPLDAFDAMRAGMLRDRSQFFRDLAPPFYGFNRKGAKVSQGLMDAFWMKGVQASIKGVVDCVKAFSETDFHEDLKKIDVPTLIVHGDDDQIVPIAASAMVSAALVKGSTLKVYPGFSNGMCTVNKDQINADLLAFIGSA